MIRPAPVTSLCQCPETEENFPSEKSAIQRPNGLGTLQKDFGRIGPERTFRNLTSESDYIRVTPGIDRPDSPDSRSSHIYIYV